MIKVDERWSAFCDRCKKIFETMGSKYVSSFKVSIEADLKINGWRVVRKKCYCPDCKGIYNIKTGGNK